MTENRKHGYWKIWGHAASCSECGFCEENLNHKFCANCGAMMNGESRWESPKISFSHLIRITCPACGFERITTKDNPQINYCSQCGTRINIRSINA